MAARVQQDSHCSQSTEMGSWHGSTIQTWGPTSLEKPTALRGRHHTKLKGRLEHHCAWGRSPSHGGSTDSRCWDAAKQETIIKDEQACFGADTMMGAHAMYSKGCSKRLKQCGGFEGK